MLSPGPKTRFIEILITRLQNIKWFEPPAKSSEFIMEVEDAVNKHLDRLYSLGFLKPSNFSLLKINYIKSGNWSEAREIYFNCSDFVKKLHDKARRRADKLVSSDNKKINWRQSAKDEIHRCVLAELSRFENNNSLHMPDEQLCIKKAIDCVARDARSVASSIISGYSNPWEPILNIYELGLWPIGFDNSGEFHIFIPKSGFSKQHPKSSEEKYGIDIGIITPLPDPELEVFLDEYPPNINEWKEIEDKPHAFHLTKLQRKGKRQLSIVAASQIEMGPASAAILATRMIERWHPEYIFIVGICGGVLNADISEGDIIISSNVYNYQRGKIKKGKFQPDFATYQPPAELIQKTHKFKSNSLWKKEIIAFRPDGLREPQVHIGVTGTGYTVIADQSFIRKMIDKQRKLIAVEMEGESVFRAAYEAPKPRPECFMIRGVSDMADKNKNNAHRRYAARVAANCAYHFIINSI